MVLMGYSGAQGTLTYEKNLMLKISCQTPFNTSYREKTRSILGVGVDSWQGVVHGP
jgi:hypothetical protein